MRSVENARVALEDGDADKAIKMMTSTDALWSRVVAPPTIHGLAMRVISDAYVAKGDLGEAKKALQKGLDLCKPHDGKAGMPEFMRQDLNGRMGDLLMALGEIEKTEGSFQLAARNMRKAAERFEVLGQKEFVATNKEAVAKAFEFSFKLYKLNTLPLLPLLHANNHNLLIFSHVYFAILQTMKNHRLILESTFLHY